MLPASLCLDAHFCVQTLDGTYAPACTRCDCCSASMDVMLLTWPPHLPANGVYCTACRYEPYGDFAKQVCNVVLTSERK